MTIFIVVVIFGLGKEKHFLCKIKIDKQKTKKLGVLVLLVCQFYQKLSTLPGGKVSSFIDTLVSSLIWFKNNT